MLSADHSASSRRRPVDSACVGRSAMTEVTVGSRSGGRSSQTGLETTPLVGERDPSCDHFADLLLVPSASR